MGVWKSDHTVITAKGMQLLSDLAGKKPLVISRAAPCHQSGFRPPAADR